MLQIHGFILIYKLTAEAADLVQSCLSGFRVAAYCSCPYKVRTVACSIGTYYFPLTFEPLAHISAAQRIVGQNSQKSVAYLHSAKCDQM